MNILFVHEVDWLKKVVLEFHNLSEALSLLNHHVYAIDYESMWQRNGHLGLDSLKTKEIDGVSRAIPGASVTLRRPGFIRIPGLSRLSAGITHYREIQRTIKENGIDVIVLYSVPTNGLQTIRLARKSGIPVVFRSIDILHRLVPNAALRPLTITLERKVYSQADLVLPNTPRYLQYVLGMGAVESRVELILMPIDTGIFHPSVDCSAIRRQWGFSEKDRIILFIGTLFRFSGLDGFIRSFPRVIENSPDARLMIVGDGPQRPELEKIITELGLERRITITGFQPYPTMPQFISLADVCINTFLNTDATRDIFPGKIVQYIACGRPTVATPLPGITTLLPGESHGVIYADSSDDMAGEVVGLLRSPERRQQMGQAGVHYVKQAHEQQKIARQLEAELEEAIERKRAATTTQKVRHENTG
ncbi:MAG: glycosyltransferase family 4 protein [Dehalococcoidales bacterium]|nr:glycosyltransferase family 4 protein [Dehalococcoidales bacterium]